MTWTPGKRRRGAPTPTPTRQPAHKTHFFSFRQTFREQKRLTSTTPSAVDTALRTTDPGAMSMRDGARPSPSRATYTTRACRSSVLTFVLAADITGSVGTIACLPGWYRGSVKFRIGIRDESDAGTYERKRAPVGDQKRRADVHEDGRRARSYVRDTRGLARHREANKLGSARV